MRSNRTLRPDQQDEPRKQEMPACVVNHVDPTSIITGLDPAERRQLCGREHSIPSTNRNVGGAAVAELARKDTGGVGKHFSVPQVLNVTFSTAPVPVNQDNLSRHSRVQQGVRGGRPNKACPNDRNLWDPRSCTLRLFLGAILTSSQCRNVHFTLLFRLMSCA
jgi:hypothetical protein